LKSTAIRPFNLTLTLLTLQVRQSRLHQAFTSSGLVQYRRQAHTFTRVVEGLKNAKEGQQIQLKGWVRTVRHQKTSAFLEVNDGSCLSNFQVVTTPELVAKFVLHSLACSFLILFLSDRILAGCSVQVDGVVKPSPPGAAQKFELQAESIKVFGPADEVHLAFIYASLDLFR